LKLLASFAVLLMVALALPVVPAQSLVPKIEITVEPETIVVDATSASASAAFSCKVMVEGMPYIRYRVNLSAVCEDWNATCSPNSFTVTGGGNNTFTTTVIVPQGAGGGDACQLNVTGIVSAPGISATCITYAMVIVKQSFGIDLAAYISTLPVDAGQPVVWQISVKNTGNGLDSVSLSVENIGSYTNSGWALRFNRSILSIEEGMIVQVSLTITPPENSPDQAISISVKGYSRGAKSSNLTIEDRVEVTVNVKSVPGGGGGGGGGNKTTEKKFLPGMGALELTAATVLLAALFRFGRRRRNG
jgi:uncharacterized membrane protein